MVGVMCSIDLLHINRYWTIIYISWMRSPIIMLLIHRQFLSLHIEYFVTEVDAQRMLFNHILIVKKIPKHVRFAVIKRVLCMA